MEDVSDKCWYCKAILPHHRRFGPLLRTTMSYEAMKRVFFLALPDGFVVKVLVANPILLYCVSYHGEKCSNQGARSCPKSFGPCPPYRFDYDFFCYHGERAQIKARSCPLGPALHIAFFKIKGHLWIESGERAMRGAGPSEAPSTAILQNSFKSKL